jgi:hypothetical protein
VPRFTAELGGRGGGRWIKIPFDARAEFGEGRAPVAGTVNGVEFRGRLSVYGGKTYLGLRREVRDAAGIDAGMDRGGEARRDARAPRGEGAGTRRCVTLHVSCRTKVTQRPKSRRAHAPG